MTLTLPRIVAICGGKRSGKDSVAQALVQAYGYEHVKISHRLKVACNAMFGFTYDQLETELKEQIDVNWGVTPRRVMQYLGTEVMQYQLPQGLPEIKSGNLGRCFWIHSTIADINQYPYKKYVISDLRFHHEVDILREHKALIIKVNRPHLMSDSHASETEYKDIAADYEVNNAFSTVEELRAHVTQMPAFQCRVV